MGVMWVVHMMKGGFYSAFLGKLTLGMQEKFCLSIEIPRSWSFNGGISLATVLMTLGLSFHFHYTDFLGIFSLIYQV